MSVVIGGYFIRETRHVKIWDEVGGQTPEEEVDRRREVPAEGGGLAG
jgi:hypothetical protein